MDKLIDSGDFADLFLANGAVNDVIMCFYISCLCVCVFVFLLWYVFVFL